MTKSKTKPRHIVGLGAVVACLVSAQVIGAGPAFGFGLSALALGVGLLTLKPAAPMPANV